MKANKGWLMAWVFVSGACLNVAAATKEADEAKAMMSSYEAEQRAAEAARAKDAAWKPSCKEVGLIQVGNNKKGGALKSFCLNPDGNILACYAANEGGKNGSGIRVYSPKGELLNTMPVEIKP